MDKPVHNFKWRGFIEPMTFLIAFSFGLSETVLTDEILLKTCRKELGKNSTDCSSLSSLTSLQEIVQPRAATILALKSFIENIVPAIVCHFFGPWSDKIGRKPILLIAATGTVVYYAALALLSYLNVDVYWYLAICFLTSLLGGFPIVIFGCYCYAMDIAYSDTKFRRLNYVDLSMIMGKLVGCLTYPIIVQNFGYTVTFAISSFSCLLGVTFIGLFLEESLSRDSEQTQDDSKPAFWRIKVSSIFRSTIQCLSVSLYISFTVIAIVLHDDNMQGTSTTFYLYAQQFQWTLSDFSIYTAIYFITTALALLIFSSKFITHIPFNSFMAMSIGFLSNLGSAFTRAFTKTSTHLYVALGVGAFSWISINANRKIVMKATFRKDLRKQLTITTILERIVLSFIIPLNIYLCTNFITTFPHPVWLMQASLQLVAILFYCGLFVCSFILAIGDDD